ncbi:MAG: ABC transporter ATP-binding protein [Rickettsiales bacterium]
MTLLNINNLGLSFGDTRILRDVSFSIEKGEMLAVVGESGSGKSLTALSAMGLQPPEAEISGSVSFNGEELRASTDFRTIRGKKISMIFQEPMTALNPLHSIGKQIGEMFACNKYDKERIIKLLEQVGLEEFKDRFAAYPHELSGGQRQRVMIAMAIANNPELLIADEPTTAVDVTIQAKILKLLKELQKSLNMAMMFITHDLTLVRRLSDRVVVMYKGQVVEQGKTADIFANPKHEYTKRLLASAPKGEPVSVASDSPSVISCENLKVYFPIKTGLLKRTSGYVKAVDDISLNIVRSSTLGIVGESGSGKTTLGFALLRLIKSNGKIVFLGNSIDNLKSKEIRTLRSKMQLVFQDPYSSLNPRMRIRQIIEEGLLIHHPKITAAEREKELDKILGEVGLSPDIKERYPHEFSGGQRQRISIARAMILKPDFVVLDEPTSALDLSVQSQIIDLLKSFQEKRKISYIFISHDLRVVRAIAQNLIVMKDGKIVEEGKTADVFANPNHDYTKILIKSAFLE